MKEKNKKSQTMLLVLTVLIACVGFVVFNVQSKVYFLPYYSGVDSNGNSVDITSFEYGGSNNGADGYSETTTTRTTTTTRASISTAPVATGTGGYSSVTPTVSVSGNVTVCNISLGEYDNVAFSALSAEEKAKCTTIRDYEVNGQLIGCHVCDFSTTPTVSGPTVSYVTASGTYSSAVVTAPVTAATQNTNSCSSHNKSNRGYFYYYDKATFQTCGFGYVQGDSDYPDCVYCEYSPTGSTTVATGTSTSTGPIVTATSTSN